MNKIPEICSLCGCKDILTKEHVPPKKAFNDKTVLFYTINREKTITDLEWEKEEKQGGYSDFVLCNKCNNNTGSWYGKEYVKFVEKCAEYSKPENVEKILEINITGLQLVRVLKQVLVMMCATCGVGLVNKNPELRKFILDKEKVGLPDHLKVFMYLRSYGGGRITGISSKLDIKKGNSKEVAEVSWWPIGWVLAFSDNNEEGLCDITSWSKLGFKERKDVIIKIPCLFALTFFPLDFRNPAQLLNDRIKNTQDRNHILKNS